MFKKLFFAVCIPLLFFLKNAEGGNGNNSEWKQIYSSDNITHYERWISLDNGRSTRERKIELVVASDFENAFHFLNDPRTTKRWMKGIKEVEMVSTVGAEKQYAHTIFRLPWPFDDKDMVASYESVRPSSGHYIIQIISAQNMLKPVPKINRIKEYRAVWELTRLNDNTLKIVFTVYSSTRPLVARFIQDPIMNRIFVQNFDHLKQLLSSPEYVVQSQ